MSTDRQDHARLDESYRSGFDHGRRWAAEELQRIAVREIRLQSSWLWHQLGERNLTEFCADLGRRLIAEFEPESQDPDAVMSDGERGTGPTIEVYEAANGAYDSDGLASVVATVWRLAKQSLRQRMFAAALEPPGVDETPALRSRFEREVRAKVAAELRSALTAGVAPPWAGSGNKVTAADLCEWAARIAEGVEL